MALVNINKDVKLLLEITDYCNSGCPLCNRHILGTSTAQPYVDRKSMSIDDFTEWFEPSFMKNMKGFVISGTYGDPIVCQDLLKILQYIQDECPKNININLDTNGGVRKESWWRSVGSIFKNFNHNSFVSFWIDGLEDTLHIYRRGVDYDTVIRNAKAYMLGGGRAYWGFLQFAHNEHQEDEVKRRAALLGFKKVKMKAVGGIDEIGYIEVDEDKVKASKRSVQDGTSRRTSVPVENLLLLKK
jgi:MoaA/NifB/PqqE/SkfB family radical SAM enzyme